MAIEKGVTLALGDIDEVPPFPEEDIEIEMEDDGSAVVDFMPEAETPQTNFQDNLAEFLRRMKTGKTITNPAVRGEYGLPAIDIEETNIDEFQPEGLDLRYLDEDEDEAMIQKIKDYYIL